MKKTIINGKKQSIDKIKKELDTELGINSSSRIGINDFIKRLDCFSEIKMKKG